MLTRDFLMRLIEQAIQALAQSDEQKKEGNRLDALRTLDGALATVLGHNASLFAHVDPKTAARLLADPDRVQMAARIIAARAELIEEDGDAPGAEQERARAVALYRHARAEGTAEDEALERLSAARP